jgi:DNA polymerase II small subunit
LTQDKETVRRKILTEAARRRLLLNPEALSMLVENYDENSFQSLLDKLAGTVGEQKGSLVVSGEMVARFISGQVKSEASTGVHPQVLAKEVEEKVEVLKSYEAKPFSDDLEARKQYFVDRYLKISSILRSRADLSPYYPLRKARSLPDGSEGKTIVMLYEKHENYLVVEDPETTVKIMIPKDCSRDLREKIDRLVPDSVIGVAFRVSGSKLFCRSLIFPDVPIKKARVAEEDVSVLMTSDIHFGSQKFSEKAFRRMIRWLRGGGLSERERNQAFKIKYIVIAGDLVDGVGVYPQQEKELQVKDVEKQYEMLLEILSQIPEYIRIIIIPGNHDAAPRALPQPPIFREYMKRMEASRNLLSLSNPCMVSLHGVRFLIYHGTSMEDIATFSKNASYDKPDNSMELMLQFRHLAPVYGSRTPLLTQGPDELVVEEVPDVFHTGHVHVFRSRVYKGIRLVNSGTWQERTKYQEQMGIMPTPNIAGILELKTGNFSEISFA